MCFEKETVGNILADLTELVEIWHSSQFNQKALIGWNITVAQGKLVLVRQRTEWMAQHLQKP